MSESEKLYRDIYVPERSLLVDEMDFRIPTSPGGAETEKQAHFIKGVVMDKAQLTANDKSKVYKACPCCRRYVKNGVVCSAFHLSMTTVSSDESVSDDDSLACSAYSERSDRLCAQEPQLDYTIKETIMEGWLHKKGTGNDFFRTKWWKPRWVTLALARVPGEAVDMPILIVVRAPGLPYPANVIYLSPTTVVMAIERKNDKEEEEWNTHCFQVVDTNKNTGSRASSKVTRVFTAPLKERNEWVFELNKVLIRYEKKLSQARNSGARPRSDSVLCRPALNIGLTQQSELSNCYPQRARSPSPVRISRFGLPPTSPRRMRPPSPTRSLQYAAPSTHTTGVAVKLITP